MKNLKRFENYEYNNSDMIFEEWKLLPTYQDTLKRKLSFLKDTDLTELEPTATHQMEIKELWRKIMKKIYDKDRAGQFIDIVDNSNVHNLNNTLDMIKKMKDSVVDKQDIGYVLYHDELNKFFYEDPINY